MKIHFHLYWRVKMWRTQIFGLLKSEDYKLSHLSKMKIAFWKLVKTEDLKIPIKNAKKMKIRSCAGSPNHPKLRLNQESNSEHNVNLKSISMQVYPFQVTLNRPSSSERHYLPPPPSLHLDLDSELFDYSGVLLWEWHPGTHCWHTCACIIHLFQCWSD